MRSLQVKGCCPLDCQDSCAWVAHVSEGRVTKVTGAKEHPVTRGVLCAKVRDYETHTYAPDRLLYPLRRTGPKGKGAFERVSWNEVLGIIARRFNEIVGSYGPEALMPLQYAGSMGTIQRHALMRLFHAMGATRIHGSTCGAATGAAAMAGHPVSCDPEDFAQAEMILLWGANLMTTSHHHWQFYKTARQRNGARIIAIDPRRTRTTEICDGHLAIRPGTDAILAAGIARVLVENDLADLQYARQVAVDVDAYLAEIEPWTPTRVAAVCDVSVADIVDLATEFGKARPATIRMGIGPMQTIDGDLFTRCVAALPVLAGHWRFKGGGIFVASWPDANIPMAERRDIVPGEPRSLDVAKLGPILTDETMAPQIKGLMIWCTNPAAIQPDLESVRSGLSRDDLFTVVLEHFMTDTARYADIVLPSTTQLEHFDVIAGWGHYLAVNNPAIEPLGEAKSHGDVMRLLATKLGLDHPALRESDEEITASILPDHIKLEDLKRKGWVKASPKAPDLTAGGPSLTLATGVPTPNAKRLPGDVPAGKLRLLTPKPHYFFNTSLSNMPRHRKSQGPPALQMNAADAGARGLIDGDQVVAQNDQGSLAAALHVTDKVRPGVVVLEDRWSCHSDMTPAAVNLLTPAAWTPAGQPAYNDIFVDVSPAPHRA
jgi:anaerobic selenocysteine-containing dehydrogenase